MAKLTKDQRRAIESAISGIERALAFINSPRIEVCNAKEINAKVDQGPKDYRARDIHRSQSYTGRNGESWTINYVRELSPIAKDIGSDLILLSTARKTLASLLAQPLQRL